MAREESVLPEGHNWTDWTDYAFKTDFIVGAFICKCGATFIQHFDGETLSTDYTPGEGYGDDRHWTPETVADELTRTQAAGGKRVRGAKAAIARLAKVIDEFDEEDVKRLKLDEKLSHLR